MKCWQEAEAEFEVESFDGGQECGLWHLIMESIFGGHVEKSGGFGEESGRSRGSARCRKPFRLSDSSACFAPI